MFTYLNARRKNLFASSFVYQIIEIENGKRNFLSHGKLNSLRSVLDIRDAMRAYWLCATRGKQGEIYNISGTYKITIKDFLKKVVNNSSYKIALKLNKDLIRPKDIDIQIADCKKFKKDTGWTPRYSLNQSINYFKKECFEIFKYKNKI
jgi:nucleoside-diphosphate-sugar epimerase